MNEYVFSGERRLWYEPDEIEYIMIDELEKAGLLPDVSSDDVTVDVERLVEQHLGLPFDQHAELGDNILGVTHFFLGQKPRIEINRNLTGTALDDEDATPGTIGRWRATVAHEIGHVLLHRSLYEIDDMQQGLFSSQKQRQESSPVLMRCLKRNVSYRSDKGGSDWREVQANMAIGALLMPKTVVLSVVQVEMDRMGTSGHLVASDSANVEQLVSTLARRFTVSKQAARIRIEGLGLVVKQGQPHL